MTTRILILGASGQLGSELWRQAEGRFATVALTRAELDITDFNQFREVIKTVKPSVVINTTAFHVLDECETRFDEAMRVNCVAVRQLAEICRSAGSRLTTVSTDYVFRGDIPDPRGEEDATWPVQAYGVSKLAGEQAALAADPQALIVRTCGLYGSTGSAARSGNFVAKRLHDALSLSEIEVGSDLVCTPTAVADLAGAMLALTAADAPGGIYHLTNEGECNWAQFTQAIYDALGVTSRVIPVDRKGCYGNVKRPAYSVLANRKAASVGIRLRHWSDALSEYLRRNFGNS